MVDSSLEIITERESHVLQAYIDVHSDECYRRDWGEHGFSFPADHFKIYSKTIIRRGSSYFQPNIYVNK